MIRLKVRRCTAAHGLEHRCYRPLTRGKDGAGEQDFPCCHTGREKTGTKTPMTLLKAIGKESMAILSGRREHEFHCRSIVTQIPING